MRFIAILVFSTTALADVNITVDNSHPHQIMEGFGTWTIPLVHPVIGDTLTPQLRSQAIDALYNQIHLNTGNLLCNVTRPTTQPTCFHKLFNGYYVDGIDAMKTKLLDAAIPMGFDDFYLFPRINTRLRPQSLEECASKAVTEAIYWRDTYHIVPRYMMPFNEPTSGNKELGKTATTQNVVEMTKAVGRSRAEGFADMKLIVPNEETVAKSLAVSQALLADDEARSYIGAIGYHCYPYGSPYASVKRILKESATGHPNAKEVQLRQQLHDLASRYNLPLWMTEVSHAEVDARSFDLLRGRAIQIHDELLYAQASAFYNMFNMWDVATYREHFKGRGGDIPDAIFTDTDDLVLIENEKNQIHITGAGRAVGHYARFLRRGAVRIEAASDNPLIQITAFRDDNRKLFTLVAINNSSESQPLHVTLKDLSLAGSVTGEQSTEGAIWQVIKPFNSGANQLVFTTLPLSVTSISCRIP